MIGKNLGAVVVVTVYALGASIPGGPHSSATSGLRRSLLPTIWARARRRRPLKALRQGER